MVEDVTRTVQFYRDVLGFELVAAFPRTGPLEWALVRRGSVELAFEARASLAAALPGLAPPTSHALTLYIDLDEQDAGLYERVHQQAEVLHPPHPTQYGTREFSIRDNNGFILTFAERMAA